MPKPQVILTPEAKQVLEAAKKQRQGYSECLLASEAILKAYKTETPSKPEQGLRDTAKALLRDANGDTEYAVRFAQQLPASIRERITALIREEGAV